METYNERTYRFGPLERGGIVLGLRAPQVVGFILAALVILLWLRASGAVAILGVLATIAVAVVVLVLPVAGHTIEEWVPIGVTFFWRRFSGQARYRAALGELGHLVTVPDGGLDPQEPGEPRSLPSELADVEYLEGQLARFDARMGVIKENKAGTYTAVLRCQGQAFALLGQEERDTRLADYGGVLAALARDGSPVRRIAWCERALPGDGDQMVNYVREASDQMADYVREANRDDASLESGQAPDELVSYLQLLTQAGEVSEDHELFFAVQIDAQRARRDVKRLGRGTKDLGAIAVLARAVVELVDLLEQAGILVSGILTRRGVQAAVRNGYDPWGRQTRERHPDADEEEPPVHGGPLARDEELGYIATDGALHSTLWVSEWPRIDVRALFLQPLLMSSTGVTRTVSMTMELVGPAKAMRAVERAATDAGTEQAMRDRIGQRTSQRQAQKEAATARREEELASGHAEARFAAFVTVSVPNTGKEAVDKLEEAVGRVDLEAKRALLRLERMWGQQADGFTYTLPLGRGLK